MNLARVEQIAKAVLYEGYLLYPYRPSSVKNRQRFNFGVLYPKAYCDDHDGIESSGMHSECLIRGNGDTRFEARIRFLQLQTRRSNGPNVRSMPSNWQEAIERDVVVPACPLEVLCKQGMRYAFAFSRDNREIDSNEHEISKETVEGAVDVSAMKVGNDLFKITLSVQNTTRFNEVPNDRDAALMQSLVSTHAILGVQAGEYLSLLDPPAGLEAPVGSCRNVGVWPVLVGDPGERDTMLASPIILYDYPQIAPESAGDLFDGTEIDEILSLRIMTLTDEEKREIRETDERARLILERTESMPEEHFMKLHGAIRGLRPVKEDAS